MPTPIPIMAAISGEKLGTVSRWVNSSSRATPIPSPANAVSTGKPIATTEPKASSMIRMAAVIPMPSLAPGAADTAEEIGSPPSSTWNPGWAGACAVLTTCFTAPVGMSAVSVVNCTCANAMLACGEIWWAPAAENGPVTLCTYGSGRTLSTTWLMAASLAAMGVDVWNTMSAVSPDLEGNLAARMLDACCDGVLPAVNLFSKCVPMTWAMTVIPMMARIQATRTRRRLS